MSAAEAVASGPSGPQQDATDMEQDAADVPAGLESMDSAGHMRRAAAIVVDACAGPTVDVAIPLNVATDRWRDGRSCGWLPAMA